MFHLLRLVLSASLTIALLAPGLAQTPGAGGPAPGAALVPGPALHGAGIEYVRMVKISLRFLSARRLATAFTAARPAAPPQEPQAPPPAEDPLPYLAPSVAQALSESFLDLPAGDAAPPILPDVPLCTAYGPGGAPLVMEYPQIAGTFGKMLPEGLNPTIVTDHALFVSGTPEALAQIKEVIALLDQPIKQIELSLTWVETTTRSNPYAWLVDPPPIPTGLRMSHGRFTAELRTLLNEGRAEIVGETRAMVPNNRPLVILQGAVTRAYRLLRDLPNGAALAEPRADFAGTALLVTPRINKDDTVYVDLRALLVATGKSLSLPVPTAPPLALETAELGAAQMVLADGETLAIGDFPLPSEVRDRLAEKAGGTDRQREQTARPCLVALLTPRVVRVLPRD